MLNAAVQVLICAALMGSQVEEPLTYHEIRRFYLPVILGMSVPIEVFAYFADVGVVCLRGCSGAPVRPFEQFLASLGFYVLFVVSVWVPSHFTSLPSSSPS